MANELDVAREDPIRTARSLRASAQQPLTTMEEAQNLLRTCETLRQPVARKWLMGRVATLLSHFYVSPMSEHEAKAVAEDWADALGEFPQWAVEEACREYLRTQDRKPTIAAIRALCRHHFAVVEYTRQKAMRGPVEREVERTPLTDEQRKTLVEEAEKFARRFPSKRAAE